MDQSYLLEISKTPVANNSTFFHRVMVFHIWSNMVARKADRL
jgi:hypothetical protein